MNLLCSERSSTIESSGAAYALRAVGQGTSLMLLHGFTGSAASWDAVAKQLASDFTVICPDLLGHGATDAPDDPTRYDIASQAADLVAILDKLGIERVGLHGYSMGGRLALYTALAFPQRVSALSLESASPGLADDAARDARRRADEALAFRIATYGVATFVGEWEQLPLFSTQAALPKDTLNAQRASRLSNRAVGLVGSLRGMGTGVQPSMWDRLGELTLPTQLMTGQLDAKFAAIADQMAANIAHAVRVRLPGAGHTVYLEQPALWLDAVRSFFNAKPLA